MRRHVLFFLLCITCCITQLSSQTLIEEGFEGITFPPEGWTQKDDGTPGIVSRWYAYYDSKGTLKGTHSAFIDTRTLIAPFDPARIEYLILPETPLPANKSYKLQFMWKAQSMSCLDRKEYTTQVVVSEDKGVTWHVIWDMTNEQQVFDSGVIFPWANFGTNQSIVDLSAYKGKTITLAYKYQNFLEAKGDMFELDEVLVQDYTPITTPLADGNKSYTFDASYIGISRKSDYKLTLKNAGAGTLTVSKVSGLEGSDFSTDFDPTKVNLRRNEEYTYNVYYTPTLDNAKTATMTLATNAGSFTVTLSGTKIALKPDYSIESFESNTFPPAGWNIIGGGWRQIKGIAALGNNCVGVSFAANAILQTPRMNLATGSHSFTLDYTELSDDEAGPIEDEVIVEFSTNGGTSWSKLGTLVSDGNSWIRKTFELGSPASDNCYIRIRYILDTSAGWDTVCGDFYADNLVLPPFYGTNQAPGASSNPAPANQAQNCFADGLKFSWAEVLHATSYTVKIGTTTENLGSTFSKEMKDTKFTLSALAPATTYYWTVIPINTYGACKDAPIWSFTTMPDQSIKTYPFTCNFDTEVFPLGWRSEYIGNIGSWKTTDIGAYEGKYSAYCGSNDGSSTLTMPRVVLPDDKEMQISFYWGNGVPVSLQVEKGPAKAPPTETPDTLYFEISSDAIHWEVKAKVSNKDKENIFWKREKITLETYKGQTLLMRWRYVNHNTFYGSGAGVDMISIENYQEGGNPVFNKPGWDVGVVNYKKSITSEENFTLSNDGKSSLKIAEVSFNTNSFTSTLQKGTSIEPNAQVSFAITLLANTPGEIEDVMTVSFENEMKVEFTARATVLVETTRCYTFDYNQAFALEVPPFTLIDVDKKASVQLAMVTYPHYGEPFAFMVVNDNHPSSDWHGFGPHSGHQCLAAFGAGENNGASDDWLISEQMTAKTGAKVRFYAKTYADDPWPMHQVSVLVSETGKDKADFAPTALKNQNAPYGDWTEFNVDLSSYEGKSIYVAIRHTINDGLVMFLDDVWFENFVFVKEGNHAPKFNTTPATTAKANELYTYQFTLTDEDGDPVTITSKGLPNWLSMTTSAYGGTISGTPTETGESIFRIIASDGNLSTTQEVELTVLPGVGFDETSMLTFGVYPTCAEDQITLIAPTACSVKINNPAGTLVYSGNEQTINVSSFPKGIYFIQVICEQKTYSTRFIKK